MKIRSLNKASTLFSSNDSSVLVDPWLIGDLYGSNWSPFMLMEDLSFLDSVLDVIITHIHEDHWDKATLKLLDKSVNFHIPKISVNNVIERGLREIGFTNIRMHDFNDYIRISDTFEFKFIPPLNSFGQEIESYFEGYESDYTNIDSGILLRNLSDGSNHLILCDNTPYDLRLLKMSVDCDLDTLWYPFNGYAQDYPFCYRNLSDSEKNDIISQMSRKRIDTILQATLELNPRYIFPHSSDFVLNGPRAKVFYNYVDKVLMDRELTAKRMKTELKSLECDTDSKYANPTDDISLDNGKITIKRDCYEVTKVCSERLSPVTVSSNPNLQEKLEKSVEQMFSRLDKFGVLLHESTRDWVVQICSDTVNSEVRFREKKCVQCETETTDLKTLKVFLTDSLLQQLLCREMHWNNAQIGFHLSFERRPNEYCQDVYKALNFLHL